MDKPPFPYHPLVTEAEVGPERTGEISADLRPTYGLLLIKEDGTGIVPCVSEKFTDPKVLAALHVGVRVKFRETIQYPKVVSIEIIP